MQGLTQFFPVRAGAVERMPEADPPPAFHVLAKPAGAACNLACRYCFYLDKKRLYPGSSLRMTDEVLRSFLHQYLEAQRVPRATVAWQGGEPTLMGLEFFRRSVRYAREYAKPGMTVQQTLQTNGTTLDHAWCEFFREHGFLIGISIDGPREQHDTYRMDRADRSTFDRVVRGVRLLREHAIDFNVLAAVHAANAEHPLEVYRFLRDEIGARFIQFIPIVERAESAGSGESGRTQAFSVEAERYGDFLNTVFDEWIGRDVGRVFVQSFDDALAAWAGQAESVCVLASTCGNALALEHNGDLYACDHYVDPQHFLGNITRTPLIDLVALDRQRRFGLDKRTTLPRCCSECRFRFACHGGCPKHRFLVTPEGEAGWNYLCAGYRSFFAHVDRPMQVMAALLRQGRAAAEIMRLPEAGRAWPGGMSARTGRNEPCPCGSGRKFKRCHGRGDSIQCNPVRYWHA